MLSYGFNSNIKKPYLTEQEGKELNKIIFDSLDVWGNPSYGIVDYEFADKIIKSYICVRPDRKYKERKKVSFKDFLEEFLENSEIKTRYVYFITELAKKINKTIEQTEQYVLGRMFQMYAGIVGEAIIENFIEMSDRLNLKYMNKKRDYEDDVDTLIEDSRMDNEVFLQVKTSSYYYKPSQSQKKRMKAAKKNHKEKELDVQFIFFHYNFGARHFIINDRKFEFGGYGRNEDESKRFEKFILEEVFYKRFLYI